MLVTFSWSASNIYLLKTCHYRISSCITKTGLTAALVSSDFHHRFSALVKANPMEVRVRPAGIVCLTWSTMLITTSLVSMPLQIPFLLCLFSLSLTCYFSLSIYLSICLSTYLILCLYIYPFSSIYSSIRFLSIVIQKSKVDFSAFIHLSVS